MALHFPISTPRLPPLWREARIALEMSALRRSDVWRGVGVEPGNGRPVLLIPGFMVGDGSLGTMTSWLERNDYWTERAGIRANVGCSEVACGRLEERLQEIADTHGKRVTIIGQSRGGLFAKALGTRRPDLVAGIVTLGSPLNSMLAVHPILLAQIGLIAALGTLSMPGVFSTQCLRGDCCEPFRRALSSPFPEDVGNFGLYSRSDGIVDWRACMDPEADEHVEVSATHLGMGVNAGVYRATAVALKTFGLGLGHPGGATTRLAQAA